MTDKEQCCQSVFTAGMRMHYHRCFRKGILKHEGRLYCKQHHPPSIEVRNKAGRHCTWKWGMGTICGTRLTIRDKGSWCRDCIRREQNHRLYEKARAYDRIVKLLAQCEAGDIRVYSLPEKIGRALKLKGLQKP